MKLGTVFTSLIGGPPGPSRPFGQWIGEAEELLSMQEKAGFSFTALTHEREYHAQVMVRICELRLTGEQLAVPGHDALVLSGLSP